MSKILILIVEDVFQISGRGTIVIGRVLNEKIEVDQKVIIDPEYLPEIESQIKDIEFFGKKSKIAHQNDYVGLLLRGVGKKDVKKKMKIYSL